MSEGNLAGGSREGLTTPTTSKQSGSKKRSMEEEGRVASTPKRKKGEMGDVSAAGAVTPGSSSGRKVCPSIVILVS